MKTFKDIGGYAIEKKEAKQIANFIKNYDRYISQGARMPRGILFYGPPGTGKTAFAEAIINASEAPVFKLTSEEFYSESNISVAIKRVFEEAKKSEVPSIILVDELDRMVHSPYDRTPASDRERDALRTLLTEIDNDADGKVLVIATSNRERRELPLPLVREGRLEKHIAILPPDKEDRTEIIKMYLAKSHFTEKVNPDTIATYTPNFTGASIETLVNNVLIDCIDNGRDADFMCFLEHINRIKCGVQKKEKGDRSDVIYHEIGHFLADYVLNGNTGMINVLPAVENEGKYIMLEDGDDDESMPKSSLTSMKNNCVCLVAGEAATEIFLGEPYAGGSEDIDRIKSCFYAMCNCGMFDDKLTAHFLIKGAKQPFGPADVEGLDEYVVNAFESFYTECKTKAKTILSDNTDIAEALYDVLKEKPVLTSEEISTIIEKVRPEKAQPAADIKEDK